MGHNDVKANMEICLKRLRHSLQNGLIYMAFRSILKILLKAMRCFLPDVFKASCKVGEKNRLQSQEANCTLPVGCTGMSLICLEWRRVKL